MNIDIQFKTTNMFEREGEDKAKAYIGDIIITKYYPNDDSPDEDCSYNNYLVVGVQDSHGGASCMALLQLDYDEIISTEFTDLDTDIVQDYSDLFWAGNEEVVDIIKKEDIVLTQKNKIRIQKI